MVKRGDETRKYKKLSKKERNSNVPREECVCVSEEMRKTKKERKKKIDKTNPYLFIHLFSTH